MPRLGITELTTINQTNLEQELAKAEWLMHGNMDGDNLLWSGTNHVTIPQGKIQDSPFNGNPIYGDKFFTDNGSSDSFYQQVWEELFAMMQANPMYTSAVAEVSFSFTPINEDQATVSPFVKTAKVEKPAHHKLLYLNATYQSTGEPFSDTPIYREFFDWAQQRTLKGSAPAVIPMMTSSFNFDTSNKGVDFSISMEDNMEDTSFIINWSIPNLDDGEYLYAGFRFYCFYRVLL
jgi:hypothetical protein